jgi:hypothetical protein
VRWDAIAKRKLPPGGGNFRLALTHSAAEVGFSFQRLPFTRKEGSRILSLIPTAQSQSALQEDAARRTQAGSSTESGAVRNVEQRMEIALLLGGFCGSGGMELILFGIDRWKNLDTLRSRIQSSPSDSC